MKMTRDGSIKFETIEYERVQCAVTGEEVPKRMVIAQIEFKGKTYYFCCDDCVAKFKEDPEKYVKR